MDEKCNIFVKKGEDDGHLELKSVRQVSANIFNNGSVTASNHIVFNANGFDVKNSFVLRY